MTICIIKFYKSNRTKRLGDSTGKGGLLFGCVSDHVLILPESTSTLNFVDSSIDSTGSFSGILEHTTSTGSSNISVHLDQYRHQHHHHHHHHHQPHHRDQQHHHRHRSHRRHNEHHFQFQEEEEADGNDDDDDVQTSDRSLKIVYDFDEDDVEEVDENGEDDAEEVEESDQEEEEERMTMADSRTRRNSFAQVGLNVSLIA